MPNLLLTTQCNRSCPYCFALTAMEDAGARTMSFGEVVLLADRLLELGRQNVGLLGGEPTIHPQILEIAEYLLRRDFTVRIFTNGLCRPEVLEGLAALPRERLHFIVNVNEPQIESEANQRRQEAFIGTIREHCDIGVNVYRADMDLRYVADLADRLDLRGSKIRIGLAQPIAGETNEHLPLEHYQSVAERIVDLARAVEPRRIRLGFDCGFPLCAFSEAQLGALFRLGTDLNFVCHPILDVAPDGLAWSCFPLATSTRVRIDPEADLRPVTEGFLEMHRKTRKGAGPGIFPECGACMHREYGLCAGGCLAHLLERRDAPD